MKPYGLVSKITANHPDNHPPRDYINWWESNSKIRKKSERQKSKKEILKNQFDF